MRCIRWGFRRRLGLCRFEDDLDAKLLQVGVDLLKVEGGFRCEHEDKQQDARMTGTMLSRVYNDVALINLTKIEKTFQRVCSYRPDANGGAACPAMKRWNP